MRISCFLTVTLYLYFYANHCSTAQESQPKSLRAWGEVILESSFVLGADIEAIDTKLLGKGRRTDTLLELIEAADLHDGPVWESVVGVTITDLPCGTCRSKKRCPKRPGRGPHRIDRWNQSDWYVDIPNLQHYGPFKYEFQNLTYALMSEDVYKAERPAFAVAAVTVGKTPFARAFHPLGAASQFGIYAIGHNGKLRIAADDRTTLLNDFQSVFSATTSPEPMYSVWVPTYGKNWAVIPQQRPQDATVSDSGLMPIAVTYGAYDGKQTYLGAVTIWQLGQKIIGSFRQPSKQPRPWEFTTVSPIECAECGCMYNPDMKRGLDMYPWYSEEFRVRLDQP